ncbi:MAG: hypothetical protein HQ526_10335, partial [Actinobacteria bacterium]|nr:hypothetical protein [Actinomycetota bacterium]
MKPNDHPQTHVSTTTDGDTRSDALAMALRAYGQEPVPDDLQARILTVVTEEADVVRAWPARWLFAVPVLQILVAVLLHGNAFDWMRATMGFRPVFLAYVLQPARSVTLSGKAWLLSAWHGIPWPVPE